METKEEIKLCTECKNVILFEYISFTIQYNCLCYRNMEYYYAKYLIIKSIPNNAQKLKEMFVAHCVENYERATFSCIKLFSF